MSYSDDTDGQCECGEAALPMRYSCRACLAADREADRERHDCATAPICGEAVQGCGRMTGRDWQEAWKQRGK